jgi:hypothetical protein
LAGRRDRDQPDPVGAARGEMGQAKQSGPLMSARRRFRPRKRRLSARSWVIARTDRRELCQIRDFTADFSPLLASSSWKKARLGYIGSSCLGFCRFSWSAAFPAVGLRAAALRLRRRPAAAACEDGRHSLRRQHRGKDRRHQTVNADVDVTIFDLDRRSVRPDLQLCEIFR